MEAICASAKEKNIPIGRKKGTQPAKMTSIEDGRSFSLVSPVASVLINDLDRNFRRIS
jgi:hypothetical protein